MSDVEKENGKQEHQDDCRDSSEGFVGVLSWRCLLVFRQQDRSSSLPFLPDFIEDQTGGDDPIGNEDSSNFQAGLGDSFSRHRTDDEHQVEEQTPKDVSNLRAGDGTPLTRRA